MNLFIKKRGLTYNIVAKYGDLALIQIMEHSVAPFVVARGVEFDNMSWSSGCYHLNIEDAMSDFNKIIGGEL